MVSMATWIKICILFVCRMIMSCVGWHGHYVCFSKIYYDLYRFVAFRFSTRRFINHRFGRKRHNKWLIVEIICLKIPQRHPESQTQTYTSHSLLIVHGSNILNTNRQGWIEKSQRGRRMGSDGDLVVLTHLNRSS